MPDAINKFYVTTPIYYVTARPHLGSLYSTVLADVAARFNKIQGKKVFFLTGTDEHGQKIAQAAQAQHKQPQEFVDGFIDAYKHTWKMYDINYDFFVRTTDPEHTHAVQQWIIQLQKQGDIYKSVYTGFYCTPCETFVTEKDVVANAQMDAPACPTCGRETSFIEEESYFFRLSAYQQRLLDFYAQHPDFITPSERFQEVISFVKSGLKDLSISRTSITWGIPFPGDSKHVCYVWADALNNYISAIGYANPARLQEFESWWPADLHIMGKDIVRFHAVYWPAFLMAAGLPMPRRLLVHGWIKVGDQKMSKSLGNAVDPELLATTYGSDPIRYYLVRHLAVTQDSPFSIADLETRINADLANDLGNLLNRVIVLCQTHNYTALQPSEKHSQATQNLQALFTAVLSDFMRDMEICLYHRAYAHVWKFIQGVNAYFQAQEPWKVIKQDRNLFEEIMYITVYSLYAIGVLLAPVMPQKMEQLLQAIGVDVSSLYSGQYMQELHEGKWHRSFNLTKIEPLFVKHIKEVEKEIGMQESSTPVAKKPEIFVSIDDFSRIELAVGTIVKVETLVKSDKLYVLTVDLGSYGIRTICSGVRKYFSVEQLLGKQGVFVVNLPPREMMGLVSQGMMLIAKDTQGTMQLVTVGSSIENGSRLQ